MATLVSAKPGWFRRVRDVLRAWEEAMDYTAADHALDRVKAVESDLAQLRKEVRSQKG